MFHLGWLRGRKQLIRFSYNLSPGLLSTRLCSLGQIWDKRILGEGRKCHRVNLGGLEQRRGDEVERDDVPQGS